MDHKKVTYFIENSFLKELVKYPSITDISYNGEYIYFVDNNIGRKRSNIHIKDETAKDFIRQIANLCEKQFSYQNPTLDVSAEKYRINATHHSISKKNNEDVINFSIRIASNKLRINQNSGFFPKLIDELLDVLIKSKVSIVIGGVTGSGKTEFQKYLISRMSENTRVIVIDNILELDSLNYQDKLDLNIWQADDKNPNSNIQQLVRNALRSNPDWLLVAESRGEEMIDVLNSSLTGHPIITTIHAFDLDSMPSRMARMSMMGNKNINYKESLQDIGYHMRFYIYLKKGVTKKGNIVRYISSIGYFFNNKMKPIYKFENGKHQYYRLIKTAREILDLTEISSNFKNIFIGEKV